MKKQTAALAASLGIVLLLCGVLAFLMFWFQTEDGTSAETSQTTAENEVLLSLSVDEINIIQVQNPNGEFTLINEGDGFVVEGLEEFPVSSLNINNLTAYFSNLTAERKLLNLTAAEEAETIGSSQEGQDAPSYSVQTVTLIDGASESLTQYGLDIPCYIIRIVTTEGAEEVLYLGDEAPNGSSIYAMYADGVYLMSDDIVESVSKTSYSFLENQITEEEPEYDQAIITLSGSVRPSAITVEIQTMEGEDNGETEEIVVSSTEKEYTMTTPIEQTISAASASQVTEGLFSLYANSIQAVYPSEDELINFGLDDPYSVISVQIDGVDSFTLTASAPDSNNYVYMMKDDAPMVYLVSASRLKWLKLQAEQLAQSVYQPASMEEVAELQVIGTNASYDFVVTHSDEITVSCNGTEIGSELFEELYQTITAIPPDQMSSKEPTLEAVLTMTVSYVDSTREDDVLILYPTGDGSAYISLNGEIRYTVDQDIVNQILDNCQNAVDGKEIANLA